jgi:hypothetical protein
MSNPQDDDLDPEAARFLKRVRWLMMIAGATTLIAVAAVIGVIGYRVSRIDGSAPAETTALLPKGARVVATAVTEERLVITLDIAGATEIRTFDLRTLRQVGRLSFASEP